MSYTLDQFSSDCRAALLKDPGPAGRELVRQHTEKELIAEETEKWGKVIRADGIKAE